MFEYTLLTPQSGRCACAGGSFPESEEIMAARRLRSAWNSRNQDAMRSVVLVRVHAGWEFITGFQRKKLRFLQWDRGCFARCATEHHLVDKPATLHFAGQP